MHAVHTDANIANYTDILVQVDGTCTWKPDSKTNVLLETLHWDPNACPTLVGRPWPSNAPLWPTNKDSREELGYRSTVGHEARPAICSNAGDFAWEHE